MLSDRFTSGSESVAVASGPAPAQNNGRRGKVAPSTNGTSAAPHPRPLSPEGRGEAPAAPQPPLLAPDGTEAAPSSNGNSTAPHPRPLSPEGRGGKDANGRFAAGNAGGPGNPFARQVAALRQRFLEATTPELFDEVFQILVKKMREGDVQAIKLFLSYAIGKPAKAPEPDLMAEDELQRFVAQSQVWATFPHLVGKPGPELPLELLREARPAATEHHTGLLGNFFDMPTNKADDLLAELRHMPRELANRKLVKRLSQSKPVVRSQ